MESRRLMVFTRYGAGDVYEIVLGDCKAVCGYTNGGDRYPSIQAIPGHRFTTGNVIENGNATNPFVMTEAKYEKLLKEKPMVAALHYANDVTMSISNELARSLPTKTCRLKAAGLWIARITSWCVSTSLRPNTPPYCPNARSVCRLTGPRQEESPAIAAPGRTSIGLWALDPDGNYYRFAEAVGYFGATACLTRCFCAVPPVRGLHYRDTID